MILNDLIVDRVIEFYLKSHDFNGIPLTNLLKNIKDSKSNLNNALIDLIKGGIITLNYTVNPHIKQFNDFPVKD